MSRVTERQLNLAFESFARACGRRIGSKPGAWRLHGDGLGYTIYEAHETGGVHCPVPAYSARLSAREMLEAMTFAESAMLASKKRRRVTHV